MKFASGYSLAPWLIAMTQEYGGNIQYGLRLDSLWFCLDTACTGPIFFHFRMNGTRNDRKQWINWQNLTGQNVCHIYQIV